ncbi:MAG: alpha/beta fold hydrolase [Dehalococcoidia bacterium]
MGRLERLGSLAAVAVAGLAAVACTEHAPAAPLEADGAQTVTIVTEDGLTLDGNLWDREGDRLVIYLHEFREDQTSWWPHAMEPREDGTSALTFDFRGHGASEGELDDVQGMVLDAVAVVDFAREQGFERVMLAGAGMGAAVALVAAVEQPDVTVVGFSTPADFDTLDALAVMELLDGRVQLVATRDDISAADSLRKFRSLGNVDSTEARLYPGGSHGVAMLEGRAGADIRARFEELLAEFWVPRAE